MGSYVTKKQSVNVTVASGTNPTGSIDLNKYSLTLTSQVGPVNNYLPIGSYPCTAATGLQGVGNPNWSFPFGITADQPIAVGTTPDE